MTFEQKTDRSLAKKLLLTEFPPEPLTQKQVNNPLNNGSAKAPDKKCLSMTFPPEPMVQKLQ